MRSPMQQQRRRRCRSTQVKPVLDVEQLMVTPQQQQQHKLRNCSYSSQCVSFCNCDNPYIARPCALRHSALHLYAVFYHARLLIVLDCRTHIYCIFSSTPGSMLTVICTHNCPHRRCRSCQAVWTDQRAAQGLGIQCSRHQRRLGRVDAAL
jgi:hypothetical protein